MEPPAFKKVWSSSNAKSQSQVLWRHIIIIIIMIFLKKIRRYEIDKADS